MQIRNWTFLIVAAGFAPLALAQGNRIGVVDADVVIQKSAKGKTFFEEYNVFIAGKEGEMKTMIDSYREKEKDFQAKQASLSEEKSKAMAVELQNLQTDIKRQREDAERESRQRLNEALDNFRKELMPLIRQVAQEKQLDLVLNLGPKSNMAYINPQINITEAVIMKYDEQSK